MRKLSTWAKYNPWKARFIIICSHVLLVSCGIYIGKSFRDWDLVVSLSWVYLFVGLFIFAMVTYPSRSERNSENKTRFYVRQKSRDFLLAFSTLGMVFILANQPGHFFDQFSAGPSGQIANASVRITVSELGKKPTAAEILASLEYRDKSSLTKMEKKILKREFKKQIKVYAVSTLKGDKQARDNAGLIILTIIGAIGLLFLLMALSCSISCGGAEGLAIVVALLGTAAIIWGMIAVFNSIKQKGEKKKEVIPES